MSKHGTAFVYGLGQFVQVHSALGVAAASVVGEFDPSLLIPAAQSNGKAIEVALRVMFAGLVSGQIQSQPVVPAYPQVGVVFGLALDGNAPENQPLEMVRQFDYDPTNWKHDGPKVRGQ